MAAAAPAAAPPARDILVPDSPADSVTSLQFAPKKADSPSDLLCSTAWDSSCCVWEIAPNGECVARARIVEPQPLLTSVWLDRRRIVLAGTEGVVKLWDVQTNQVTAIGQHSQPVRQVLNVSGAGVQSLDIASCGWDRKLKYWDLNVAPTGKPVLEVDLPDRGYCMDSRGPLLVVATAERHIVVYDLRKPDVPLRNMMSPLKFQSRCIAILPAGDGFALGSIEGRVNISYLPEEKSASSFSFKCHRKGDEVFSVNAIAFHPTHGTFATVGGDGGNTFWDHVAKSRLKMFTLHENAMLAGTFSPDGHWFAYALGYDFSRGPEEAEKKQQPCGIALHRVLEADVQRRPVAEKK